MIMEKRNVITEIPPISSQDTFVMFDRKKTKFDFPLHVHNECEINFVKGASGARRIVGDSVVEIGDLDLVLVAGKGLEHGWFDSKNEEGKEIYEVTIQFQDDLFASGFISRKQFRPIRKMLAAARNGISFPEHKIKAVEPLFDRLLASSEFSSVLLFLELLNALAADEDYQLLSHYFSNANPDVRYDGRRIAKVMEFLNGNYQRNLSLSEVARVMNMSQPSFCRFIKQCTGKSFINCLNDIRIGAVCRDLVELPTATVSEIAYKNGFNNLSNFNRIFRRKKGMTPQDFRECYSKKYTII